MTVAATLLEERYLLDEEIGAGGFCEVWRATDTVLTRPVAVKLLHPGYASHAEARARLKDEARHAGALSHENIARVYDYGEPQRGQSYLVMELIEGPSLATVLADGPPARAPAPARSRRSRMRPRPPGPSSRTRPAASGTRAAEGILRPAARGTVRGLAGGTVRVPAGGTVRVPAGGEAGGSHRSGPLATVRRDRAASGGSAPGGSAPGGKWLGPGRTCCA